MLRHIRGQNGAVRDELTTGRLLVSTPAIEDGVFHRSVILMLQHDRDGAQGVVLNKPIGADVDAVLPGWGAQVSAPATLFQGGPVQLDSALCLVDLRDAAVPAGVQRLFGGVGIADLDEDPSRLGAGVSSVRIFAGYAGWSPGQLEDELRTGSWFLVDAFPDDAFTSAPGGLWQDVLRRQPGELSWVALLPEDPTVN